MHLALDVYYAPTWARAACVGFASPADSAASFTFVEQLAGSARDYEPGMFKTRELPYLERLVAASRARTPSLATILIDAYVTLDEGRPGLGAHLFAALDATIPIIGIAKTRYRSAPAIELLRGTSHSPLFITSAGIAPDDAAAFVRSMHGDFRIPTMLRLADRASRGHPA
jgi:deoxyribonuclease V